MSLKAIICSLILLVEVSMSRSLENMNCVDPDMSKLKLDVDELHESFYQLPSMREHIVNSTSSAYIATHYGYMHGPKQCPTLQDIVNKYDGHICPVYYVLNHDINRIPKSYVEAVCSCQSPPIPTTGGGPSLYECAPLTKFTKVQRRIGCDKDGVYIYSPMWEKVKIGCYTQIPILGRSQSPKQFS